MSNDKRYVVKRTEEYSDELQHWGNKGSAKEEHKYVSRKMVNGKWVYTYPEDVKSGGSSSKTSFNTTGFKTQQTNTAKSSSPFNTSGFKPKEFEGDNKWTTKTRTQQAQKNQSNQAAAAAERQNASIKRAQQVQARNNRINDAARENAERQANALAGAKAQADKYKQGYQESSSLRGAIRKAVTGSTGNVKEGRDRMYDAGSRAGSANVAKEAKRKVKKSINKTIKSAKKQINKGKKWLDNLFD